ncbi:MAG TPA: hypothetical protein VG900_10790 [Hyphomicrobiaceae bacterium]|nr:hypothetical protein [Hyphomicrobiaceae bacterium]
MLLFGCRGYSQQPVALGGAEPQQLSLKDTAPSSEPVRPAAAPSKPQASTCGTPDQCKLLLQAMVSDPKRHWIAQPEAPTAYANGTRLFAYRALRTRLNCRELSHAVHETEAAAKTFATPVPGVTPDQAIRVLALNATVERELRAERKRRCKA